MFSDPFSAVMALVILAFAGTLAVFFRIWRELDAVRRSLAEVRESLQYLAVDAAQQNRDLVGMIRDLRSGERAADPAGDCLGELLEKGIPNLMDAPKPGSTLKSVPPLSLGDAEENDFLRRFEPVPGKGATS